MTIEDDATENLTLLANARHQLKSLKFELESVRKGRELFASEYAKIVDGLHNGTLVIPGHQIVSNDFVAEANTAEATRKIETLESDLHKITVEVGELRASNGNLAGDLEIFKRDLKAETENLESTKSRFREAMASLHESHRKQVDSINAAHLEAVQSQAQDHNDDVELTRVLHNNEKIQIKSAHTKATEEAAAESARALSTLKSESDVALATLTKESAQVLAQVHEDHKGEVTTLKNDAEAQRVAAERKYNDLIAAHEREVIQIKATYDAQINRERLEAKKREDAMNVEYRNLQDSIPSLIKDAKKEGRSNGLRLSRSVTESAHDLGLDPLASPALRAINKLSVSDSSN